MCVQMHQPLVILLFVYLMAGSDYISQFYRITHATWLDRLIEHYHFIVDPCHDPTTVASAESTYDHPSLKLCHVDPRAIGRPEEHVLVNLQAAMRFVSTEYFRRGKSQIKVGVSTADNKKLHDAMRRLWIQAGLPHEERLPELRKQMDNVLYKNSAISQQVLQPGVVTEEGENEEGDGTPAQMANFLDLLRRAVFLSNKTEAMFLPSHRALELHLRRSIYVLRLALESVSGHQPSLDSWNAPNSGWETVPDQDGGGIRIVWDDQVQSKPGISANSATPARKGCKCNKSTGAQCTSCTCTKSGPNKGPCDPNICGCDPARCRNQAQAPTQAQQEDQEIMLDSTSAHGDEGIQLDGAVEDGDEGILLDEVFEDGDEGILLDGVFEDEISLDELHNENDIVDDNSDCDGDSVGLDARASEDEDGSSELEWELGDALLSWDLGDALLSV